MQTLTAPAGSLVTGGDPDELYPMPREDRFKSRPERRKPDLDFIEAPQVAEIAGALMARHPELFGVLSRHTIHYRWKRTGGAAGGKATLGKCVKLSGLTKHFAGVDFVIWLAADHCAWFDLTAYQVEALVFHELLHATEDNKGKPAIWPHQFEGFVAELEEYGAWTADLDLAARAMQQLQLPLDAANGNGHGEL